MVIFSWKKFRRGDEEDEFYDLLELPGELLPDLIQRFYAATESPVRACWSKLPGREKKAASVPFLKRALETPDELVWQQALDGLVALASPEVHEILLTARTQEFADTILTNRFRLWLEEAIQQVEFELRVRPIPAASRCEHYIDRVKRILNSFRHSDKGDLHEWNEWQKCATRRDLSGWYRFEQNGKEFTQTKRDLSYWTLTCMSVDEDDPRDPIYAGTEHSGLFYTKDAGAHWQRADPIYLHHRQGRDFQKDRIKNPANLIPTLISPGDANESTAF